MSPETVLFKSEEKRSRADIATFLRELADKVESGAVVLLQGGEKLELALPETLTLEIKAEEETKRGAPDAPPKRSLEVELEWREGDESAAPGGVTLG